jgi:pyruvate/2-oxoglutarate dehydrogenase complex dihydrolipoamide acyltransferase (E2) component
MSRRKQRAARAPAASAAEPEGAPESGGAAAPQGRRIARDLGILVAVFAATAGIAELAGAANLGVALGVGQVAFAIAAVVLLLRG